MLESKEISKSFISFPKYCINLEIRGFDDYKTLEEKIENIVRTFAPGKKTNYTRYNTDNQIQTILKGKTGFLGSSFEIVLQYNDGDIAYLKACSDISFLIDFLSRVSKEIRVDEQTKTTIEYFNKYLSNFISLYNYPLWLTSSIM